MKKEIFIPHHIWISRKHKKAIRKLTSAEIMPHDKAFVWSPDQSLADDCRLIEEYIEEAAQ